MRLKLYRSNSMVLRAEGLENHEGETVADATVTATLSRAGAQIWSGTLAPVVGSSGDYEAAIASSLVTTVGESLSGLLTITSAGLTLTKTIGVVVAGR